MSLTRWMPSALTSRTWGGGRLPAKTDSRPGIRLSRISVVLPGTGDACHHGESALWNVNLQGLDGVNGTGREVYGPDLEKRFRRDRLPCPNLSFTRQKGADLGGGSFCQGRHCALSDDLPASRSSLGAHFD